MYHGVSVICMSDPVAACALPGMGTWGRERGGVRLQVSCQECGEIDGGEAGKKVVSMELWVMAFDTDGIRQCYLTR